MASHAARGKIALDNKEYKDAIDAYTAAIQESPSSADYFIQRSIAYQRSQCSAEALRDTEQAVLNAQARNKLESIAEAQFRRGVALFSLERYADANFVLDLAKRKNEKHKMVDIWIAKTKLKLKALPLGDAASQCNVVETPTRPALDHAENSATVEDKAISDDALATGIQPAASSTQPAILASQPSTPAPPQQTPVDKIRHEWYQNSEKIFFTLLAKGVPQDGEIAVAERSLSISFPTNNGTMFDFFLDPLYAAVDVNASTKRILPSKVEVVLVKAVAGQRWAALESPVLVDDARQDTPVMNAAVKNLTLRPSAAAGGNDSAPAYPTSSKSGPKNWDTIVSDLSGGKGKTGDGDRSTAPANDDDDDDDEGPDAFFKKLFKGASPDMQRAMIKSYTESNGTSLSNNWDEVSKGPVEMLPPDGMEAKKW